jgi:hypothetical protein
LLKVNSLPACGNRAEPMAQSRQSVASEVLHHFCDALITSMSNLHESCEAFRRIGHWNKVCWLVCQIFQCMDGSKSLLLVRCLANSNAKRSQKIWSCRKFLAARFVLRQVLYREASMLTGLIILRKASSNQSWDYVSQLVDNRF